MLKTEKLTSISSLQPGELLPIHRNLKLGTELIHAFDPGSSNPKNGKAGKEVLSILETTANELKQLGYDEKYFSEGEGRKTLAFATYLGLKSNLVLVENAINYADTLKN